MKRSLILIAALSVLAGSPGRLPGQQPPDESAAERDARMQWWREARFGMFIHWGVYAVPAGTYDGRQIGGIGEWIMRNAQIPVADYRAFAREFNPTQYDPEAWAALAAEAGMKYMVITSKHHDGFALFPSAVTDWDVADATPYGKDLIGPLAAAARRHGLKFGLYYSQAQDWTHPGGAKAGLDDGEGWDAAHKGRFDDYLARIAVPQVREILTQYRPDILWWDTPHLMTRERADLLRPLTGLRPGLITNNRLGGGYAGDTDTPEQHIPATGMPGRDWETCMTMNDTWGYKSYDQNWKSAQVLIRNLVDIASKGGNYLLNVGPTPQGTIPQESVDRLREVGRWMKVNGAAIYGTTASPTRQPAWGRITTRASGAETILYLHIFDWPADGVLPVAVSNEIVSCQLLGDPNRRFPVRSGEDGATVSLTGAAPDEICSVVTLTIRGAPQVVVRRIAQQPDGRLVLMAADADLHGRLQVESKEGRPNVGYWTERGDWIEWAVRAERTGEFEVTAELATEEASRLVLTLGERELTAAVPDTGGYGTFRTEALGRIRIDAAGAASVTLRADPQAAWAPVNIRSIVLTPAR